MGQPGPATGIRVALLNQGAELASGLRQALLALGADIVFEGPASSLDRAALDAADARVIVVSLGADDEPIGAIQDLLDAGRHGIVINDTEASARLGEAEQARWARLLVGKILQRPDLDLPQRPPGAQPIPGSAPSRSADEYRAASVVDAPLSATGMSATAEEAVWTAAEESAPGGPGHGEAVVAPDWSLAPLHEAEDASAGKPAATNEFGIETVSPAVYLAPQVDPASPMDLDFDLIPLEAAAEQDPVARDLADALRARASEQQSAPAPPGARPPNKKTQGK